MGKTTQQETTSESKQEVDPALVEEYGEHAALAKLVAGLRTQPNRNVTIAALNPAQKKAMRSNNKAARAFGMDTQNYGKLIPGGIKKSAHGIKGYSTAPEFDKAVRMLPDDYKGAVEKFYAGLEGGLVDPSKEGNEEAAGGLPSAEDIMSGKATSGNSILDFGIAGNSVFG